jgi:ATP-dependent helicase Lhr and Lhr-like helicase
LNFSRKQFYAKNLKFEKIMQKIQTLTKKYTNDEINLILTPIVKDWFFNKFKSFSEPQKFAVMEIHKRENILVSAPTGATKTLTAFLSILNELVDSSQKGILENRIYCVYISPLKALNNDVRKNLQEPLKEMEELAGKDLGIRVMVRTGDTTASEKQKMLKNAPHILITTPESLAIMLCSPKFRENLRNVQWCIVDEIHALADNKRGVNLSLSLERLEHLSSHLCRVGLSATVSPLDEVAKFLVGSERNCNIADIQFIKNLDFKVLSPVDNLIDSSHELLHRKMYELIHKLIQENKTTLIFTNTRAATERVVDSLKNKFPKFYDGENIGAHHGSLGKKLRFDLEENLRNGKLKCVVCSTSLELGIDIGFIDLVLCLGSPKSVARFLQRAGRSGHKLHETVKARMIVMDRDDLVECSVLMKSALEKKIDRLHIPKLALDILAQQIIGMAVEEIWDEKELFETIKKSYCYADLSLKDFNDILDYLSGEFVKLEERYVFAKIWRKDGKIGRKGRLGRVIYMTNLGTIPDESFITVKIGDQTIGMLDEGFVERLKPGDVFVLGGQTYQFKFSRGMVAQVSGSVNRPPTVPSWVSEMLPLSFDLASEIGRFRRLMLEKFNSKKKKEDMMRFINDFLFVDDNAANAIYEYFNEQFLYCRNFGTDKTILIEYFNDGIEKKIIFHTMFGRRVNDCLSRAIAFLVGRLSHKDVEVGMNDNGFYIAGDKKLRVGHALKLLKSDKLDLVMDSAIEKSEIFKRRFRHCAGRSFLILRNYLGKKKRVGRQQVSSMILMSALKSIDPDFSILREAKREVLEDLMDINNARNIVKQIEEGKIKIVEIETSIPSPFAFKVALQGFVDVLKIEDKHEFLHRMHQLVLAKLGMNSDVKDPKELLKFEKKDTFKDKLRKELFSLKKLSGFAKAEISRIIDGERTGISEKLLKSIEKKRKDIEKEWPDELKKFVFKMLDEIKGEIFDYDLFWKEQDDLLDSEKEVEKLELLEQLNEGARKDGLDPQIRYDLYRLIDGEKGGFRKETVSWIKSLLSKKVPKHWKDKIVIFLQERLKEIL